MRRVSCASAIWFSLAALVTLTACGSRPPAVLVTFEKTVPGASTVDMLVATTRAPSLEPGVLFSGERDSDTSLENIVVSIPPEQNRRIGEVALPRQIPPDPNREFAVIRIDELERGESIDWYNGFPGDRNHLLLFVHGFNNTYESAVFRFAQIVHDSKTNAVPVLFTWPSKASIFAYNYDRESANFSRTALSDMIEFAIDHPEIGDITIMAHSMGSWLTMEALRQVSLTRGRIPDKITNVILASPDVDIQVFSSQLRDMGPERPHITIFTSLDDRALKISRRIAGGVDRLGAIDPSVEPYSSELERAGVTVMDLTKLQANDRLNHSKFAESPEVVKLIGQRLIDGQEVTDSDVSLAERIGATSIGLAQTAGSAVGAVATLPIAIVDENARKDLGDRVEATTGGLGDTLQTAVGQ